MADLVGSDVPTGDEVKWYYSGKAATYIINRDYTINGASITKGKIMLGNTAEFGLVWGECTRSSTTFAVPIVEYSSPASAYATNTTNTTGIKIPTQCTVSDVLSIKYINVGTTALTHIASCRDVKTSRAIDTKSISVQGQQNKLKKTGAADLTADLSEVTYSQTFLSALYGDEMAASVSTQGYKWSDITTGIRKLGCIIGKRYVNNVVVKKWALIGVQPSALNENFPTEDYYTRDLSLVVDNLLIWDNE
jgi:hypothetical protein